MLKIGFIINPVAGMGGKVALKGTDGAETLRKALACGAVPEAHLRAEVALAEFIAVAGDALFLSSLGRMGADLLKKQGAAVKVVYEASEPSSAHDTQRAIAAIEAQGADLIVFAGGDGTARDICAVIGETTPVVGIPAGVKIHSSVYANKPRDAGTLVKNFLLGKISRFVEAEVMDIDEEAFRENVVRAKLFGYMKVPDDRRFMQNRKSGGSGHDTYEVEAISAWVVDNMERDALYLVGSGSTTMKLMNRLGLEASLLGVDALCNGTLIAKDMTEAQILALLETFCKEKRHLVITVIGGQGHIFGRGNQQLSPDVVRMIPKKNIIVVAAPSKMAELFGRSLIADTGDSTLDAELCGYMPVVTGYRRSVMTKVV